MAVSLSLRLCDHDLDRAEDHPRLAGTDSPRFIDTPAGWQIFCDRLPDYIDEAVDSWGLFADEYELRIVPDPEARNARCVIVGLPSQKLSAEALHTRVAQCLKEALDDPFSGLLFASAERTIVIRMAGVE